MSVREFERTAPSTGSTFAEEQDVIFFLHYVIHMATSFWLVGFPGFAFSSPTAVGVNALIVFNRFRIRQIVRLANSLLVCEDLHCCCLPRWRSYSAEARRHLLFCFPSKELQFKENIYPLLLGTAFLNDPTECLSSVFHCCLFSWSQTALQCLRDRRLSAPHRLVSH